MNNYYYFMFFLMIFLNIEEMTAKKIYFYDSSEEYLNFPLNRLPNLEKFKEPDEEFDKEEKRNNGLSLSNNTPLLVRLSKTDVLKSIGPFLFSSSQTPKSATYRLIRVVNNQKNQRKGCYV
ncbi:hypothetical protein Mgra_00009311 [Meloidogyne graminicola]|uniref:Uncharacterized protein n=1 Tax=Meloidogyne graminicola TaxID=189291 RepID=A0A8S9ZDC8_9BILA|nr:hypothetical protein Mgra_00009311 [Meloidogyne graminicola]